MNHLPKLLAMAMSVLSVVNASPMATCGEQYDCIAWTLHEALPGSTCAGQPCEWTACARLNLDAPNCVKSGTDTISHVCEKSGASCALAGAGFATGAAELGGLANGYETCQTGVAGSSLQFLFKDGLGCTASTHTSVLEPSGADLTCVDRPETVSSCTGNKAGVECIWTVQLPPCTMTPEPVVPSPPPAPCPRGKKVCYTEDCQCVVGSCTRVEGGALTEVLVGYTGSAGSYTVAAYCPSNRALSNAVKIGAAGFCTKEDSYAEGQGTTFTVDVDANGNVLTPFSMKCGRECFIYESAGHRPFPWACNN